MKKLLFTFLFLLMATPAYATQLLMFSNPNCGYCQAFLKEVKPTYHQTEYSKYLPLSVLNSLLSKKLCNNPVFLDLV